MNPSETNQSAVTGVPEQSQKHTSADSKGVTAAERLTEMQAEIQALAEARLAEKTRRSEERDTARRAVRPDDSLASAVSELRSQFETLESDVGSMKDQQAVDFKQFSADLESFLTHADWTAFVQGALPKVGDLNGIANDLDRLREQTTALRATNDELKARVRLEFDTMESLFSRTLDSVDEIDAEIESRTESLETEVAQFRKERAERETLKSMKSDAICASIRRGNCELCDQTVDLATLESPSCPNCETPFASLDNNGNSPFQPPILKHTRRE